MKLSDIQKNVGKFIKPKFEGAKGILDAQSFIILVKGIFRFASGERSTCFITSSFEMKTNAERGEYYFIKPGHTQWIYSENDNILFRFIGIAFRKKDAGIECFAVVVPTSAGTNYNKQFDNIEEVWTPIIENDVLFIETVESNLYAYGRGGAFI